MSYVRAEPWLVVFLTLRSQNLHDPCLDEDPSELFVSGSIELIVSTINLSIRTLLVSETAPC